MRPTFFRSNVLRQHLLQAKMATLDELKRALGTQVDLTVFRKLKPLNYLTSYSHRARYYTLRSIARFDADGLWSQEGVWFSRHGTLLATAEAWVQHSPQGYFAEELAKCLHVPGEFLLKPRLACERAHDNGHANDTISRSCRR